MNRNVLKKTIAAMVAGILVVGVIAFPVVTNPAQDGESATLGSYSSSRTTTDPGATEQPDESDVMAETVATEADYDMKATSSQSKISRFSVVEDLTTAESLVEELELSQEDAERISSLPPDKRTDELVKLLEDSPLYEVYEKDGKLVVDKPYALKRLAVFTEPETLDTSGAASAVYSEIAEMYVMTYDTMAQTAEAFDAYNEQLGDGYAAVDFEVHALGASSMYDGWGVEATNMGLVEDALDASGECTPVMVAVTDSGCRSTHVAFQDVEFSPLSGDFMGSTSVDRVSEDFSDANGHGTHVTSIITGNTPDSVSIFECRAMDSSGNGSMLAVYYGACCAASNGARVVNMSLGSKMSDENGVITTSMQKTMDAFDKGFLELQNQGVMLVAAAGNEDFDFMQNAMYPGCSPHTVAVGSITKGRERSSFSNYGDGIDFVAPGSSIRGAYKTNDTVAVSMSGTSMAAPHIAAFAANLMSLYPDDSVDEIYAKMKAMCVDYGEPGYDIEYGYGMPVFDLSLLDDYDGSDETADPNSILNGRYYPVGLLTTYRYTGQPIEPSIRILARDSHELVEGTDFTVSYANNTEVGRASVTVTGIGDYHDSATLHFNITR